MCQVAQLSPIAKGGEKGLSWREDLAANATLTDCFDRASVDDGLFSKGDFSEFANELEAIERNAKSTFAVFGVGTEEAKWKKSKLLRGELATTRGEALLLRLFQPDAIANYSPRERDDRVRLIKGMVQKHARWGGIFKAIHNRAVAAMAMK